MRAGVAAYHVPSRSQFTNLGAIYEAGPPNPVRGYEEMTTPIVILQRTSCTRIGTHFAVIECEEYQRFFRPLSRSLDRLDGCLLTDRIQVIAEVLVCERIGSDAAR